MPSTAMMESTQLAYRSRGYQLEMLEASCKENIIVAMDTGSGKTHIAILRMIVELERCSPEKLIWFLVPTVALCLQQHEVIKSQIPTVKTKILTGMDNVDRWTDQSIWDAVLKDTRIVISTHAVLADALGHGFVQMSRIALLVFDEAHHCRGRHPANRIMQNHYHPTLQRSGRDSVPAILGLTASPVVQSKKNELEAIEANLDAVCKTPREHRAGLLENTHRPHLNRIDYAPFDKEHYAIGSQLLLSLIKCCGSYNLEEDPWVMSLREKAETLQLEEVIESGQTFCSEQLRKFLERSCHIYEELGGWATDTYISTSIDRLRISIQEAREMSHLDQMERLHLLEQLRAIPARDDSRQSQHISFKLQTLFNFLSKKTGEKFSGLIFAKRRVTVSMLVHIFSMHPKTRDIFNCGAFVGWASSHSRKDSLGDLLHREGQRDVLEDFRTGKKNLLVATDVLEEGIDVSACNLVICFDKPANLKSFVQRRGRARHQESTFAVMISTEDESLNIHKWQELEEVMIEAYQDETRHRKEAWELEGAEESVRERLWVEKTNALLTPDDAIQHLHHFCDVLPVDEHVDNRPVFSFEEDQGLIRGIVTLPNSVHPSVRQTRGKAMWRTERAAGKEAAFQTYKSLYEYGLVNDNLLPLAKKPELRFADSKALPSILDGMEQYDPYMNLARAWGSGHLFQSRLRISNNGVEDEDWAICLVLPAHVPMPDPIPLYLDTETTLSLSFDPPTLIPSTTSDHLEQMRRTTFMYLQAPSSRIRGEERDYVALFIPDTPHNLLGEWLLKYDGAESALEMHSRDPTLTPPGIVRDKAKFSEPRIFTKWIVPENASKSSPVELECRSLQRRRNLLQTRTSTSSEDGEAEAPRKTFIIPAATCDVDKLPQKQAIFGLMISAILDRLEASSVAHCLNDTILKGVGITDIHHVITAITTPLAQASVSYQRYEFFGDSVLKFTVSCQLFFRNKTWHEGYLSESRDKLIQNSHLTRAALDTGIDTFILTNRFTPRKWNAPLIRNKLNPKIKTRRLSSKVLADVVESLIGAAYVDGGIRKAQACLHRFLPEINLFTSDISPEIMPRGKGVSNLINEHRLAGLIGYTFKDPALLTEALTHASCEYDMGTQSYQRLEFLGDAVLDMVVMAIIAEHPTQMDQGPMTILKHSVVNANLLAFFCMELSAPDESMDVEVSENGIHHVPRYDSIHLWRFLRSHGPNITAARESCLERHRALRDEIQHALRHGQEYPWELFARLRADKFLSDIIESTLGAIFIDCGGDLDICREFVERIGLVWYVQRIIADNVNVVHPRNIAQSMTKSSGILVFNRKRVESKNGATYRCSAIVNKVEIALVEDCASGEEAEVKVANLAIQRLKADPTMLTT
ncbi:hypothetical protein N7452_010565 [Penicillium brevicompactum]|uniref:Dicer-like protein 2 n=1 Tax=Penicillium brevicompactum TaxID=5074 RepID=A0A9W9QB51_PENBR|nr:hypothetical protein N7452_010565 [Penicillium brevicompactum]